MAEMNPNILGTLVFNQEAKEELATMVEEGGGGGGTEVIANPTLVGDEAALSGLQVAGTKYKVAADITIDTALDSTSTNPVQNKVVTDALDGKQATLVSGTNIKTINSSSILGTGNITISEGTNVVANPTLAGSEDNLTGLQVGDTKYKLISLPAVTSADNGKVLIVKNGQWAVDFPSSDLDALMQEEF